MATGAKPAQGKVSVWLVERHPLVAFRLRQILAGDSTLNLYSLDGRRRLPAARKLPEPVLLLDRTGLPEDITSCMRSLQSRFINPRLILLGNSLATDELCRLLFLGVHGFVSYDDVEENLLTAIHAVAQGHLWVAPDVLERYVSYSTRLAQTKPKRGRALTHREKRILELVERRLSNKEIGSILDISESTVKFHLGNIFIKLGVHDRHAVVEMMHSRTLRALLPWQVR